MVALQQAGPAEVRVGQEHPEIVARRTESGDSRLEAALRLVQGELGQQAEVHLDDRVPGDPMIAVADSVDPSELFVACPRVGEQLRRSVVPTVEGRRHAGASEGGGQHRRVGTTGRLENVGEAAVAFARVPGQHPVERQVAGHSQRLRGVVGHRVVERRHEVVMLPTEARQPGGVVLHQVGALSGQPGEVLEVQLRGLGESVDRVLAVPEGFADHGVHAEGTVGQPMQQRLVDQASEQIDRHRTGVGVHGDDGIHLGAAGEGRHADEQHPFRPVEQRDAPVDRVPEGLMTLGPVAVALPQQRDQLRRPAGHLAGREDVQPGGGELDRQGQPFE